MKTVTFKLDSWDKPLRNGAIFERSSLEKALKESIEKGLTVHDGYLISQYDDTKDRKENLGPKIGVATAYLGDGKVELSIDDDTVFQEDQILAGFWVGDYVGDTSKKPWVFAPSEVISLHLTTSEELDKDHYPGKGDEF